jgi:glucosamine 6-phosphate synthetase-like amidotransferase/phosphosugar isomerase protein
VLIRVATAETVVLPGCHPFAAPIRYSVAVQLLAYGVAVLKGTDVDQPRNQLGHGGVSRRPVPRTFDFD